MEQETAVKAVRKLEGREKSLVEFGPIVVLLAGYVLSSRIGPVLDGVFGTTLFGAEDGRLYTGLALFLPAFIAAFVYSMVRTKRVAPIMAVTGVLVIALGALTFIFQDKRFFYVKPTIVYGLMAAVLAGGLLAGKNFLKVLFDGALEMGDAAWRTLTWRFVAFNAAAAVTNEVLWRTLTAGCVEGAECSGEATWLWIKGVGFTLAYFAFIAANAPFLMKNANLEKPAG